MRFKSLSDLSEDINQWVPELSGHFDCVVGVPRSGMLVASMLALKLNLPLADLDGFLDGRVMAMGLRFPGFSNNDFFTVRRRVLLIDDSIASGNAITEVQMRLGKDCSSEHEVTLAAVYVTPESKHLCDLYFQLLPNPRRFEWNILSTRNCENYAFDLDGVFCLDPTNEENDDGERYVEFIRNALPINLPAHRIGPIVTSRLEKYRQETEAWLSRVGIDYDGLYMLDLPTKEERIRLNAAPKFKAQMYSKLKCELFIESEPRQALEISKITGNFVYSLGDVTMYGPDSVRAAYVVARNTVRKRIRRKISRYVNAICRRLPGKSN